MPRTQPRSTRRAFTNALLILAVLGGGPAIAGWLDTRSPAAGVAAWIALASGIVTLTIHGLRVSRRR